MLGGPCIRSPFRWVEALPRGVIQQEGRALSLPYLGDLIINLRLGMPRPFPLDPLLQRCVPGGAASAALPAGAVHLVEARVV